MNKAASFSFDLSGKRAVVTGASRGIGQAVAKALAEAGCDLAVTARSAYGLEETCAIVGGLGRRCIPIVQDITDADDAARGVRKAAEVLGGLDILINNAGVENVTPSLEVDEALWQAIVGTNLKGAFFAAQAAGRIMSEGDQGGSIVNLCSLTSYVGVPGAVPYTSSKSGLLGMTRALATEWALHRIRVNAIAPGYFRTAMTEGFYQDPAWEELMLSRIPQRRFGQLGDLGGVVVFLCSDAAAYVVGHCIPVDGGFLASI
jgi:NAD(P)-dependent dehydrogenase (short-subunit alcohol dehydrogenase family)